MQQQQVQTPQPGTASPCQQVTMVSTGLDWASITGYVEAYEPEEHAVEEKVHTAEDQADVKRPFPDRCPLVPFQSQRNLLRLGVTMRRNKRQR